MNGWEIEKRWAKMSHRGRYHVASPGRVVDVLLLVRKASVGPSST